MRIYLVQDSEGTIVATAPCGRRETMTTRPGVYETTPGDQSRTEELFQVEVKLTPLPGQTIHEVELPAELEELRDMELHYALLRYRVSRGESVLLRQEP